MQNLVQSQKWQNNLGSFPRQMSISESFKSIPQRLMLKKLNLMVLWRPTRPFGTNTNTRCPFYHSGLECKSRNSRETWSGKQVWLSSTKYSRTKTNRVLPRKHLVITNVLSNKSRDNITHGHHQMVITKIQLIIFFAAEDEEAQCSQQKQDQELTGAHIMNSFLQNSD